VLLLSACSLPGSVRPTVKIGLSAPFEGLYRELGYEALHAVRLAVRQRNETGGVGGRYLVEFVALNDFNQAGEAVVQARKMAVDADVMGVLGGWSPETAQVAAVEYERLGLAFLSPEADFTRAHPSLSAEAGFVAAYSALSGGKAPGAVAIWAYSEANRLLDALEVATRDKGQPTRLGVQESLVGNR
jgi:ABC-type branched-subunit amino acid transport system substrate-binding protein